MLCIKASQPTQLLSTKYTFRPNLTTTDNLNLEVDTYKNMVIPPTKEMLIFLKQDPIT